MTDLTVRSKSRDTTEALTISMSYPNVAFRHRVTIRAPFRNKLDLSILWAMGKKACGYSDMLGIIKYVAMMNVYLATTCRFGANGFVV